MCLNFDSVGLFLVKIESAGKFTVYSVKAEDTLSNFFFYCSVTVTFSKPARKITNTIGRPKMINEKGIWIIEVKVRRSAIGDPDGTDGGLTCQSNARQSTATPHWAKRPHNSGRHPFAGWLAMANQLSLQ